MTRGERSQRICFNGQTCPRTTSFLPFLRLGPNTPALVLGPLKLAKKYQADVLRHRITAHLSDDCPTTLHDWDKVAYPAESDDSDPSNETSSQSSADIPDYLTKDFFPDPASYLTLAHECDLPVIFASLLYSLCRDSTTRKEKLSHMTKRDMETLFLGKDRMIYWISGPAANLLEIESWIPEYRYEGFGNEANCQDERCRPPLFKAWSKLLQDVMCYGDPLATFRATVLKYRKYVDAATDRDYAYGHGYMRDEICVWCKGRMADKLDDLRQDLFDELPSFFPLRDVNS